MQYLRLPIAIQTSGDVLTGEIYLPSRMRGVSICVNRSDNDSNRLWMCEMLSNIGMGTVLVRAPENLLAKHLVDVIDWIRAKRLLRTLPINIIATASDAIAANKAAERRPVAVRAVLCASAGLFPIPGACAKSAAS